MSWGLLDPSRLLKKQAWKDAGELARELWSMASSSAPADIQRPVSISAPRESGPALQVRRAPSPPASTVVDATRRDHPSTQRVAVEGLASVPPRPSTKPKPEALALAHVDPPKPTDVPRRRRLGDGVAVEASISSETESGSLDPTPTGSLPPKRAILSPGEPGSLGLAGKAGVGPLRRPPGAIASYSPSPLEPSPPSGQLARRTRQQAFGAIGARLQAGTARREAIDAIASPAAFAPPHAHPVAEIDGPVDFVSKNPVEAVHFGTTPKVWNDAVGAYEELMPRSLFANTMVPWLTDSVRMCYVNDMSAADFGSASPSLGKGTIKLYDLNEDGSGQLDADPYGDQDAFSYCQFPWAGCWAWAWLVGDHWFARPMGDICVASGTIGPNTSAYCTLSSDYGSTSAKIFNDTSNTVDDGSGGNTLIFAGIDFNGKLKAVSQSC